MQRDLISAEHLQRKQLWTVPLFKFFYSGLTKSRCFLSQVWKLSIKQLRVSCGSLTVMDLQANHFAESPGQASSWKEKCLIGMNYTSPVPTITKAKFLAVRLIQVRKHWLLKSSWSLHTDVTSLKFSSLIKIYSRDQQLWCLWHTVPISHSLAEIPACFPAVPAWIPALPATGWCERLTPTMHFPI